MPINCDASRSWAVARRSFVCPQQQHPARGEATAADHTDPGAGDLAIAGLAAQLEHGLVDEAEPVQPAAS